MIELLLLFDGMNVMVMSEFGGVLFLGLVVMVGLCGVDVFMFCLLWLLLRGIVLLLCIIVV